MCRVAGMALIVAAALLHGGAMGLAWQSQPGTRPGAMMCPVMTDQEVDPNVFVDWDGRRVLFCCKRCKAKFEADPDKYASAVIELQGDVSAPGGDPSQGQASAKGDESAAGDHSNSTDPKLIRWLGKFHPASVHLPIGILLAAAIAEVLFARRRSEFFENAARFCTYVAACTGVVTGTLGWFFGGLRLVDADWLLAWHRWVGTATAVGLLVLAALVRRAHQGKTSRKSFRIGLTIVVALLLATGYLGGARVWGLDEYVWPS